MPSQPPIPLNQPWEIRTTPEVLDQFIVEMVDRKSPDYKELETGTPHPKRNEFPGVLFCLDVPMDGSDRLIRRYWSADPQNQDLYNYGLSYSSESVAHPIWARRYLIRRDESNHAVLATGTAFTGVFLVKVTDGGEGYKETPAVTLTGGAGTGATAKALMTSDGSVGWVRLMTEGAGYTSAPTVSFVGGGGSGAAATAVVQGAAKLVHQELQELPVDEPRRSLYVVVMRVWETIPGPELVGKYWDLNRGVLVTVKKQVVLAGTAADTGVGILASSIGPIDSVKSARQVEIAATAGLITGLPGVHRIEGFTSKLDERTKTLIYKIPVYVTPGTTPPTLISHTQINVAGETGLYVVSVEPSRYSDEETLWTVLACKIPDSYVEFDKGGVRFPGLFTWLQQFTVPMSFAYTPPFPGVHYNYLPPRTNTLPLRVTHFFTLAKPTTIPEKFTVISPGTMSKMVPIREDTIHPSIDWIISDTNGNATLVEHIPASDPTSYDPNEIYVWDVETKRWLGDIYETIITEASEGKAITYFPPVQQGNGLTIGPFGGGLDTADYSQTGFYAVNTNAGANVVSLFGYRGPTWTKLTGSTPADAGLLNLGVGLLNTLAFISGDGVSQSDGVEVYTYGVAGTATVTFTGTPANNDQIKLGFLHGSATYNTTYTFKTTLSENILATGTLTISGVVIDAETATIGTRIYEFDTHAVSTITTGNIRVDISPYAVAAQGVVTVISTLVADTFVIGSKTFTFVTAGTEVLDGEIPAYPADASASRVAVYNAINGLDGVNTAHPTVSCGAFTGTSAILTAKFGGTSGNSIVLTDGSSVTFDDTVMGNATAGTDCTAANAVTALVAAITADTGAQVTAVDGTGDTVVVTSKTGGTAANLATTETMANGSWGGANLTGGTAAVANQILIGGSATNAITNLLLALNGTGTVGTNYSTGTTLNTIVHAITAVVADAFTISTIIPADWESFGNWQTGSNFQWIDSAHGAIVVGAYGSVTDIAGAVNGDLVGTLTTANHSLICNAQTFDDPQLGQRNFPSTPDTLTTGALLVGNRTAQIWFGGFGGMPLSYEKSVDGSTGWIAGSTSLASFSTNNGRIHKVGITDFSGASTYRFIRFKISTAIAAPASKDYGLGNVSRLFLQVVWTI